MMKMPSKFAKYTAVVLAGGTVAFFAAISMPAAAPTANAATGASAATAKAAASTPLIYGAWLPFWTTQAGEQEIALHLNELKEISPFSYEIVGNGTIVDDLKLSSGIWDNWLLPVRQNGNKIIPTIAWFNADGIETLLSNGPQRRALEDRVAALVKNNNFNGIDIDFEGMYPATRQYYSLFIEGLAMRLHPAGKMLTCTVVPRTPVDSLYVTPPDNIVYPENYPLLNQYCDEVRIMAYDQQTVDIKLNASKGSDGTLYAPVADPDWVQKLITYALQYISPKKLMLGIPTYGYEYEVSWANGKTKYQRVRAFDFFGAMDRADSLGIEPVRNNAGELSFTFASTTYIAEPPILTSYVPSAEPSVLMHPNPNATTTFYVSFPDATSELQKVALAKKYGLRGVVFFKADGQMDPAIWDELR
jgi:spore germination protein YaaH